MKELIEKIKKLNGNEKLTNNELLWYVVARTDHIIDKLDKKVDKSFFYWIFGSVMAIIFGALGFIFKFMMG